MNKKIILFAVAGWLLAMVVPPRDLLAKLRG